MHLSSTAPTVGEHLGIGVKDLVPHIDSTLAERGTRYGSFLDQSTIACNIKEAMAKGRNWSALDPDMRECLDMVAVKIARILNGDPRYHDSWHDIVGYTKLVADRLAKG